MQNEEAGLGKGKDSNGFEQHNIKKFSIFSQNFKVSLQKYQNSI